MTRTARRYLTVLGCAIVLGAWLTTDASAQATRVPISGLHYFLYGSSPPDRPADGITFREGTAVFYRAPGLGDLVGYNYLTFSNHWNTETREGRGYGETLVDVCYHDTVCGTFETRPVVDIYPSAAFQGNALSADAVGRGSGGFEGMTIFEHADCDLRFNALPPPYPLIAFVCVYTGEILDPSGTLQP